MSEVRSKRNLKAGRKSKNKRSGGQFPLSAIPGMIPLAFKLGVVYLKFKRKAKKAAKVFKKELIANGIDKNTAENLTEDYLRSSRFLRQFDFSDMTSDKR